MFGYRKDHLVYVQCPKNGCMTYSTFLSRQGWERINLFDNDLDLNQHLLWAHITEPVLRHTRGLEQYLKVNPDIDINQEQVARILISGVFDEHTYSLSMMLAPIWYLPIYWIPLDATITKWNRWPQPPEQLDGDALTNHFWQEQGLDLCITAQDRLNVSVGPKVMRDRIQRLKITYQDNWNKIMKNFLELDVRKYHEVLDFFQRKYQ